MQKPKKTSSNTKDLRLEVQNLLLGALNHLKELWGEKKFNNKVEEAAKLLTKGLKKEEKAPKEVIKKDKAAPVKSKEIKEKKERNNINDSDLLLTKKNKSFKVLSEKNVKQLTLSFLSFCKNCKKM